MISLLLRAPGSPYVPCPHFFPLFYPHRLLSATKCVATKPFAVEDYLVATCGLTQAQALKASKHVSHLKDPSKADAVVAFLSNLGLSSAEITDVVTRDPKVLCSDVERSLTARVAELTDLGFSRPEIVRLLIVGMNHFRHSSLRLNLEFWISVFGSLDELIRALRINAALLSTRIEEVCKPNLELLQECGINVSDISNSFMSRVLTRDPKSLQEALARLHEFRIQPGSQPFFRGLYTFAILGSGKITKSIQLFEKLGWSKDHIVSAVKRDPTILGFTEERVRRNMEFLIRVVGLEVPYIARRPALINYSIDRRLLPRNCLINFLRAKGLFNDEASFLSVAAIGDEKFRRRYVHPYEEDFPGLAAAFASSCAGEHQWERLYKMTGENKES
uniref:mTERF transcription factor n=3 Tax=Zea mays TaxID=4577 RepID=B7ZXX8_MAIZE|nr:unknown [Zea mays]